MIPKLLAEDIHLPKRLPGRCQTSPGSTASTSHRAKGVARVMSPGSGVLPLLSAPGWLEKRPVNASMTTWPSDLCSGQVRLDFHVVCRLC